MNCKPGDLAVIVAFMPEIPQLTGRIVDVIEAAPVGVRFKLPDGKWHHACRANAWVIRFHNPLNLGAVRGRANALYAASPDYALRPIRDPGDDAKDEMLRPLPKAEPAVTRTGQEVAA